MTTLVFVHGACVRDADWWWSRMTQPLAKLGVATVAVALPSCGETGDTLGDLYDDVEACHQTIAEVNGPVVLCGHSYGGMIITEAGADERVTQLLYVTSVMPDAGQSQAGLIGAEPAPWLQPGRGRHHRRGSRHDPGVLPPGLRREHNGASGQPSHPSIPHTIHSATTPDRLEAEARDVLRLHRGSRHPGRGAASTRQSGYATRRVQCRASSVSLTPRRVRRSHRCRDRPRLIRT